MPVENPFLLKNCSVFPYLNEGFVEMLKDHKLKPLLLNLLDFKSYPSHVLQKKTKKKRKILIEL